MSKVISVRIPDQLKAAIALKAKSEGVSSGELIKRSIELSLKTNELEIMKTAHEKQIKAIEEVGEISFGKTMQINNYLNLTEQKLKSWNAVISSGIPKYSLIAIMLCSAISAISTLYLVLTEIKG